MKYLENIVKVHERTISDLEDENVHLSKEHEERQLIWEQREVELERMIDKLEKQQEQLADAAAKFEEATGSIPDPNLPVANQLELAIRKIKEHIRIIVGTREENKQLKKVWNDIICKGLEVWERNTYRILHCRAEIRNFSSNVETYFTTDRSERVKYFSTRDHLKKTKPFHLNSFQLWKARFMMYS